MSTPPSAPHFRSLYRRLLRELPSRQPSILANPSPLHKRIRTQFAADAAAPSSDAAATSPEPRATHAADSVAEYIAYLKAQRTYITLLERYNPGMNMLEEDRVRLTARRVGMDLPPEWAPGQSGTGSGSSGSGRGGV